MERKTDMDKLKNRYFIRYYNEVGEVIRMPLASRRTLMRVFMHFIIGNMSSLEIYREDYFNKKVFSKERIDGILVRGEGITMRAKTIGTASYDKLTTKFSEGLYNPEKGGVYSEGGMTIAPFTEEQFEDSIELLTMIQEGSY